MAGHAMGCSVICGYWEQYGGDRLSKLILVDQMPMITRNPARPAKELENAGAIFDGKSLFETINALAGPGSVKTTKGFITGIFAKQYSPDEVNWVVQEKCPRAMQRAYGSIMPPTIGETSFLNIPTLAVGGKASLVPRKSQIWTGGQIKGTRTEIFEENEGGAHFMSMENPEKFNRLVKEFNG
jgi:non-heme chloroperoxidase